MADPGGRCLKRRPGTKKGGRSRPLQEMMTGLAVLFNAIPDGKPLTLFLELL
jgi:hypothetical protein